jgi:hypothetical protein
MQNDEFADLLWGAQAIADYIGRNYRQTVYLLSTKKLPAQKIGAMWIGHRGSCVLDCLVMPPPMGAPNDPHPHDASRHPVARASTQPTQPQTQKSRRS